VQSLGSRERGLLDDLGRLDAELERHAAEHERLTLELGDLRASIEDRGRELTRLESEQLARRRYLLFRLRERYKDGPEPVLRRIARDETTDPRPAGGRYVAYLTERDARFLRDYRAEAARIAGERDRLVTSRLERETLRGELAGTRWALEAVRRDEERLLTRIRGDRATREAAIGELGRASAELSRVVESIESPAPIPVLDVRKFRGLLDWPAVGRVGAGFGNVVHPRFRTTVPHPGLDIEAAAGAEIRTVFDGRVAFASWMRGYGLTALIDHGGGVLSVYAHAAALVVEPGETVANGQRIGIIGDTGSLRGPYLYFELRDGGQPVDPSAWLRPR